MARPPNEDELRNRFNQLVGTRTGRPSRPKKASSTSGIKTRRKKAQAGAGREAISTYVRHGGGKVSASTRKASASFTGAGTGTEISDPTRGANRAFQSIFDNMTKDYNQQILDQNAVRTTYAAQTLDQAVNPENPSAPNAELYNKMLEKGLSPEDAANFATPQPSVDEQYLGGNLQKYVVEPLARPGTALFEGFQTALEQEDPNASTGRQFAEAFGNFGEGFKAGITGEAHTGFGDVYETWKDKSEMLPARGLRKLEEVAPWAEQAIAVGTGIAGEIGLDPVGKVVGGAKVGVIGGKRATSASMRAEVRTLAERWAADVEDNIITTAAKAPGNYRPFPSEAAIADHFEAEIMRTIEHAENTISAGGSRGRYEVLNPKMTAGLAGAHGSQALQQSLTSLFSDRVQRLADGASGRGPRLTGQAIDNWASLNPDFTDFIDDLTSELINNKKLPANATTDTLANYLTKSDEGTLRRIEQEIVDTRYSPYIQDAADTIAREFRNSYYNTPGIRIGKSVIPVKPVGKAYSVLTAKAGDAVGKNFRYNSVFPGSLSLDTTRARAFGIRATEEFEAEVRQVAKDYTKIEAEELQRAIENNNVHTLDQRMQYAANWIKDQYRWMYDEEFTFGARGRKPNGKPSTPYDPNYAFVSNKGGGQGDRTRFKQNRKDTIRENVNAGNDEGAGRFKTANAKEGNLRPVESAFEALHQRRLKYNRDMTRARYLNDMIDKYGIHARINPTGKGYAAQARGLEEVNFSNLPEAIRTNVETTGEKVYLPKEMADMINTFDEITKWHPGAEGRIQRSFASVMRVLKKGMTLPWPGFHNKNMIGDVFMGLLDGIMPWDYSRVIRLGTSATQGVSKGVFKIIKGNKGLDLTFREMWHKYQSQANSGFISSELGTLEAPIRYNLPTRVISKTGAIAQDISGFREDAGRFTHYSTAYTEEARALWKKGERNLQSIDRQASSAALWRVNNYKFDYNALMLWEKKAKTLYFPFYTFMRKAAPTLVQALYQDPRWINIWTRFLHQRSVDGQEMADSFDGFRVPEDIRDVGYAFIGGEEERPWYVTNDILPTSVFNSVRTENPHEFFNSLLSQSALPFQVAVEQGTGRQTFLDRPLEGQDTNTWGGMAKYLGGKLPGSREFSQIFDSDKPWQERLLSSRIGAGLPIKHLEENQQLFAEQEWQDRLIDDPLQQINYSQDLFYISRQPSPNGKSTVFTVKNRAVLDPQGNSTDVASFHTPEEAIQYVKQQLPDDYKKVPTTMDIDPQGNPYQRPVGG